MAAQKKIGSLDESVLVHWNGPDLPSLPAFRGAGRVVRTAWQMPTTEEFAGVDSINLGEDGR
ncbi:MAG: hypothetical protein ABIK09_12160 [Pseudomonadota bacterium]